jgi:hypothetical protein
MKKLSSTTMLLVIFTASLFAQSDPQNFVQTGTATHEMESHNLVAAHAILPIGQEVLVTNLESGAQVTVTVTERIRRSNSRIIDLSNAAAVALAIFDDTARVTIEAALKTNSRPPTPAPAATAASATTSATPAPAATSAAATAPAVTSAAATAPAATSAAAAAPAVTPAAPEPASDPVTATAPTVPEPAAAPVTATAPVVPETPAAPPPAAAPESASAPVILPPPPSTGYTPTSEITPIVPPWETDYVIWPAPQNDPWLPELAQPWISGAKREQAPPRVVGPAQTPTPAFAPPPVSAPEPAQSGLSVKVLPRSPGSRDSALYRLQVGAYSARISAQRIANRLSNAGLNPVLESQGDLTRVQIPQVRGYEVAAIGQRLYTLGFREVWIWTER